MSSLGWKVFNMLLGKSREQLLIAPVRMKQLGQSGNSCSVDVSGGESKVQCCKKTILHSNLVCSVYESR